jgi:hypothetical protein
MAYVVRYATDETRKQLKRRVCNVLFRLAMNGSTPSELRIVRKFPSMNWKRVWKNLHASAAPVAIKSTCCTVIHGLTPTNERLAAINFTDTITCTSCGHLDSQQHRITQCGEGPIIWTLTKKISCVIIRMNHRYIPQDWTLRPAFQHWPAQKQAAVLWILAHLVHYRLQTERRLSLLDYVDFLLRARCKFYHQARRPIVTGSYLDVLDWPHP